MTRIQLRSRAICITSWRIESQKDRLEYLEYFSVAVNTRRCRIPKTKQRPFPSPPII